MKKRLEFKIFKLNFFIPVSFFILNLFCFIIGVCISFFLNINIENEIFSPLIIYFLADTSSVFPIFFHSFLYFMLFPLLGFILAASFFGFIIIPALMFFKAVFSILVLMSLFLNGQTVICFTLYAPILALEISVLHLYLSQSMYVSKCLFSNTEKPAVVFHNGLKQFSIIALYMLCLSLIYGLWQYLIL